MRKIVSFIFNLALISFAANAQPPILIESKPFVYKLGKEISPLALTNLGGPIPISAFCNTTTFAGNGSYGSVNGTGASASFNGVSGVAIDKSGNVYVADTGNNMIRKISINGEVIGFAGNGSSGFADGVGNAVRFDEPYGLAVDEAGNIYVADTGNNKIRKILPSGEVTTLAGSGSYGSQDGSGLLASFDHPYGVAVDNSGNVYVADTGNHKIRIITPSGVVSTLAGTGNSGSLNGTSNQATFKYPFGLAVSAQGEVFVADSSNNMIRKIDSEGRVSTIAGNGTVGDADGVGAVATFKYPFGLVVDSSENIYVADSYNNKIRKISQDGRVTTISGSGIAGAIDGTDSNAEFNFPCGIAMDTKGSVYIADFINNKIRKISVFGYTVYPPLPTGLRLDSEKGIIDGTPTVLVDASDYIVTATNFSGSDSVTLNITIEQPVVRKEDLVIYPNPVTEILKIKVPENATSQNLKVIDIYGKVVIENDNRSEINVQSLKSGIYIIHCQSEEESYQMKFVKS